MKMSAAEALFETEAAAAFSVFATGALTRDPGEPKRNLKIPHMLSLLATRTWDGKVVGINELERQDREVRARAVRAVRRGHLLVVPRDGLHVAARCSCSPRSRWWLARKGRLAKPRRSADVRGDGRRCPFIVNTAGWVMTEMGRQPWIVQGLLQTKDANSPLGQRAPGRITLIGFTLIYASSAASPCGCSSGTSARARPPSRGQAGRRGRPRPHARLLRRTA